MDDVDRCAKTLDKLLDRYKDEIGCASLELLLQKRAQDMRELSVEQSEVNVIGFDELSGYND